MFVKGISRLGSLASYFMGEVPHSRRTCVSALQLASYLKGAIDETDVPDSLRSPSVEGDDGSFFASLVRSGKVRR